MKVVLALVMLLTPLSLVFAGSTLSNYDLFIVKETKLLDKIDAYATYAQYQSKDGTIKFINFSDKEKNAYILSRMEIMQESLDEMYKQCYLDISDDVVINKKTIVDPQLLECLSKILNLRVQLIDKQIKFTDSLIAKANHPEKKEYIAYKLNLIRVYESNGLLKKKIDKK